MPTGGGSACTKPTAPGADSSLQYMGALDACAANVLHQNIIANAFACDITRVACLQYGNDQKLMVNAAGTGLPYDDQHGGFIHSGASSNFANLVKFEAYLATQFVNIINLLKGFQDPEDSVEDAVRHRRCWCGRATWATPTSTTSSRCASCSRAAATAATSRPRAAAATSSRRSATSASC
jgi:hypothetical protein